MKRKAGSEARTKGKEACRAATWRALGARSGFIAAHENVAITLARKGNLDDAVAEFGSIFVDRSDRPDAHYNLGLQQEN